MKKAAILALAALALPSLMAAPGNATLTNSEKRYCQRKAESYADDRSVGNTVGGAIGGAVVGGIIGGLVTGGRGSGVGTGAAIGAGVGGVGGAARSSERWRNYYWKKYDECIRKYR